MSFEIRQATENEAPQITQLAHLAKAYWGYSPEFMAACDKELTFNANDLCDKRYVFRVGTYNKNICSFYALDSQSDQDIQDSVEMIALFVEPTLIGKGLGRQLFEHSVQLARTMGVKTMMIHSDPYAEDFYTKMGAVNIGTVASGSIANRALPLLEYKL